jgi:ABC-type dipeptide/oligopeptide/nickel transport systems, permease components
MIRDFFKTLIKNKKSLSGLVLLGFFILVALFAPLLAPYPPKTDRVEHTTLLEENKGDPEVLSEETEGQNREKSVYTVTITQKYEKRRSISQPEPSPQKITFSAQTMRAMTFSAR